MATNEAETAPPPAAPAGATETDANPEGHQAEGAPDQAVVGPPEIGPVVRNAVFHGGPPAPWAHLVLLVVSLLPAVFEAPAGADVVVIAAAAVYVGTWRSPQEKGAIDTMTHSDAVRFPVVGSVVLLSLFLAFKILSKDLINLVVSVYCGLLGTVGVAEAIKPFMLQLYPEKLRGKMVLDIKQLKIPVLMPDPEDIQLSVPDLVAAVLGGATSLTYVITRHWLTNNALGLAFCLGGIQHIALGTTWNGVIMLCGLFFYDIFWVFCTPVMVAVATSFDAPIKLLFPRFSSAAAGGRPFSLLGLGDIVIPGLFVSLMFRYDVAQDFKTRYFPVAMVGYVAGLSSTLVVMYSFKAAQPALLYIVPALLLAVGLYALKRGELMKVLNWQEEVDQEAIAAANAAKPEEVKKEK